MNAQSQLKISFTLAAGRQQVFLRAVVGSIVLCAALGASASAQTAASSHELSEQAAADEQLQRARSQRLHELLAEIRNHVQLADFESDRSFSITLDAEAVGNEDDPLHSFKVECGRETDEFWCETTSQLVAALRGGILHNLLKDARRVNCALKLDGDHAVAHLVADFSTPAHAGDKAHTHKIFIARVRQDYEGSDLALVLNNMAVSANGKQLAMKLEMSRAQAGNLLRQRLSLP